MDQSFKLQMDIKNNAEDLRKYVMDLRSWEDEMKEKEKSLQSEKSDVKQDLPPPRNKIKRSKSEQDKSVSSLGDQEKKPKRIPAYDYSAWDKFDVEKACEEVDKEESKESVKNLEETRQDEEESDESDEEVPEEKKDFKLIDEAFYEKELGNQFVRKEKWDDAIKCYTRAIELDSKNAIYYANRSLCFLKLRNFRAAEVDATIATQLDKKYIKAYQRRALARTALGQLKEAMSDYDEILVLEPKNSLAIFEKSKIEKKLTQDEEALKAKSKAPSFNPKNIFDSKKPVEQEKKTAMKTSKSEPNVKAKSEIIEKLDAKKPVKVENKNLEKGDGVKIEEIVEEKKSGILIEEIVEEKNEEVKKVNVFGTELEEGSKLILPIKKPPHKRSKKPLKRIIVTEVTNSDDKIVTQASEQPAAPVKVIIEEKVRGEIKPVSKVEENKIYEIPRTCVQFQSAWKFVRHDAEKAYSYLKNIYGQDLAKIFENSLESDLFSEIILALADEKVEKNPDILYFYLQGLRSVKRFKSLIMFMSSKDKEAVKKCIGVLESSKSDKELKELRSSYEI